MDAVNVVTSASSFVKEQPQSVVKFFLWGDRDEAYSSGGHAVCLRMFKNTPIIEVSPIMDMGTHVQVGGGAIQVRDGRYRGLFFAGRRSLPEDAGAWELVGMTKLTEVGSRKEQFRPDRDKELNILAEVEQMLGDAPAIRRTSSMQVPRAFVVAEDTSKLIPGREVDQRLFEKSVSRGSFLGLPEASQAGKVLSITSLDGNPVITTDTEEVVCNVAEFEEEIERDLGRKVAFDYYPLVAEGQKVKAGQALVTPLPVLEDVEEVDGLANVEVLRWLVVRDSVVQYRNMTLVPLSVLSPESSRGTKFFSRESCSTFVIDMAWKATHDPLTSDLGGVRVDFRATAYGNYILGNRSRQAVA